MSYRAFFFGILVVALLIFSLYRAKYGAKDTEAAIAAVEAEIAAAREEKALLETELAHMSRRDWIEEYARTELGMAPPKPGQMVYEGSIDDVIGPPRTVLPAPDAAMTQDAAGSGAPEPEEPPA